MTPPDLDETLASLEGMPRHLQAVAAGLSEEALRRPGTGGAFSLVEHAWHLADLEREGYGERIRRLLTEEDPLLPDFDGDRVARERCYRSKSFHEGLAAFASARAENLSWLRSLAPEVWERRGRQEGVGPVRLGDIPRMMLTHDTSHRASPPVGD